MKTTLHTIYPLMDKLSGEKKGILIMGDFNDNLLNYNNERHHYCSRYNVFQLFFTLHHFAYQGWKHLRNSNRQHSLQQTTQSVNNDMIAGNLCSVISDHLIQFLVEPFQRETNQEIF